MKRKTKIALGVLAVLILIQLIQPARNLGEALTTRDINHSVNVPQDVQTILQKACYDCHSNHTNYIWYCSVQPVGLWIGHHINEGKEDLNFSEFNTYTNKRKTKKLAGISKQLKNDKMPITSYRLLHPEARLTEAEKNILISWADAARQTIPGTE